MLKPNGVFARFAYHVGLDKKRKQLTDEIQELYGLYLHKTRPPKEFDEKDAENIAGIASKYGFTDVKYQVYRLTKDFSADEYMELLKT